MRRNMQTEKPSNLSLTISDAPAPVAVQSQQRQIVDSWFNTKFPGSAVAQTTEGWNFLHAAKEELIWLLEKGN